MSRPKTILANLMRGQNDSRVEEGSELPRFPVHLNARLKTGAPTRRSGWKHLAQAGTDAYALSFASGSSDYVQIPAHSVHALTPPFSMEILLNPDTVAPTQKVVAFLHASGHPFGFSLIGTDLDVYLTDSALASTTLSATGVAAAGVDLYARVTCNEDGDLDLFVDGATTANDTSAGALAGKTLVAAGGDLVFGRDNGGDYYDGRLDYFRCVRYVIPDSSMAFTRWPTPRAPYMLWDYGGELDANNWVHDRSSHENHGEIVNSTATGTALAVNPAPVQVLESRRDKDNKTRLFVAAGGRIYNAEV